MSTSDDLLQEIKDAAETLGIAPTTLCQRAVKHGGLIERLERGGKVTTDVVDRIRAYIAANQPKEAAE
jgi:predicted transcriptional regulator of viral defense system